MRLSLRQTLVMTVFLLFTATAATASVENKKTNLDVHQAIEVPGAVLQPGHYTLELLDTEGSNHTVIFRNADGTPVTTTIAIPAKRNEVTGNTKFTFYETPADAPPALRTWFYPGDMMGQSFAYPESRSKAISAYSKRHVPTMSDDEYNKMSSDAKSKTADDVLVAVPTITVFNISPEGKKSTNEDAERWNTEADREISRPERYMTSQEVPQTRLDTQIRKEIVTLPFYSLWDHIEFRTSDTGNVELMGKVYRPSMKKSVERAVKNVEGVKSVTNKIETLPTSFQDDQIRRAEYRAIYGHPALQDYQLRAVPPIHIIVDNGNVTLEGVVANQMDKNIAGVQANTVNGVFSVQNNLRVENSTTASD